MEKIKMTTPLVEMDGDEMTRILWQYIKDELLLPFVDLKTEYYDLGLEYRNIVDRIAMRRRSFPAYREHFMSDLICSKLKIACLASLIKFSPTFVKITVLPFRSNNRTPSSFPSLIIC